MAILKDGKIISNKEALKQVSLSQKNKKEISQVGRKVWFIEKTAPFSSYDGTIISEPINGMVNIKCISNDVNNCFSGIKQININDVRDNNG